MECKNEECDIYPYYGVAPHECFFRKEGGFKNSLGTSTIKPHSKWPDNFLAEVNPNKPINEQLKNGLCGIYFCPSCKSGVKPNESLWGPARIKLQLKREVKNF